MKSNDVHVNLNAILNDIREMSLGILSDDCLSNDDDDDDADDGDDDDDGDDEGDDDDDDDSDGNGVTKGSERHL